MALTWPHDVRKIVLHFLPPEALDPHREARSNLQVSVGPTSKSEDAVPCNRTQEGEELDHVVQIPCQVEAVRGRHIFVEKYNQVASSVDWQILDLDVFVYQPAGDSGELRQILIYESTSVIIRDVH